MRLDEQTAGLDPYAPPRAEPGAPVALDADAEAQRRAYKGTERALAGVGVLFGILGSMAVVGVITGGVFVGIPRGAAAVVRFAFAAVTTALLAFGGFALARLHALGRACLTVGIACLMVSMLVDAALELTALHAGRATVWLLLFVALLGWLWAGRPGFVLSPAYREVMRKTPQLERKTSIVAWLLLAVLLVGLFVAVWSFFAGGPKHGRP